ncbi:Dehydroquinate synthase-like protein [Polychaeton citri CBS 116435]|uniref:Dehydroquinate synthase-like protein n=1 Tax=Polychaeton citri CBS 116435 TaxID=1314669 RepID=A0A9P4UR62_9PEZI|nr:Dehydroquinate synthase-like protein [Polychaeton citri CBS 116435]
MSQLLSAMVARQASASPSPAALYHLHGGRTHNARSVASRSSWRSGTSILPHYRRSIIKQAFCIQPSDVLGRDVKSSSALRLQRHSSIPHFRQTTTASKRFKTTMTEDSQDPLSGLWMPTHLQRLHYGSGSVGKHLLGCLPKDTSKAFIISTNSLASKTDLIKQVEAQLGPKHAGTFSKIGQHAPVKQLDEATNQVLEDESIDTIISIGGGSPIDSAKAISYRLNEKKPDSFLYHIAIPTTLSAAECTLFAGYTSEEGRKIGVAHPKLVPQVVIYDSKFVLETPPWLVSSTAMRAMDHAMEMMYHPYSTEYPCRKMALAAAGDLFQYLPLYKQNPKDEQAITMLQLASFGSLGFYGYNAKGGLGLSHSLGYALGSPYQIPHGITSCLTLGHVVKLKAKLSSADAVQIARMVPYIGLKSTGDTVQDALAVGDAVLNLVEVLGLKTTLTEKGVDKDQIDVITRLATASESGEFYDRVRDIVANIY